MQDSLIVLGHTQVVYRQIPYHATGAGAGTVLLGPSFTNDPLPAEPLSLPRNLIKVLSVGPVRPRAPTRQPAPRREQRKRIRQRRAPIISWQASIRAFSGR